MLYFNHEAVVSITTMQILTNHRPRSHITTTATNDSALWFSITARFHNTVVISYNIGVIYSTNDATSEVESLNVFCFYNTAQLDLNIEVKTKTRSSVRENCILFKLRG